MGSPIAGAIRVRSKPSEAKKGRGPWPPQIARCGKTHPDIQLVMNDDRQFKLQDSVYINLHKYK